MRGTQMSVDGFFREDDGNDDRPRRAATHRQRLRDSRVFIAVMTILALVAVAAVAIVGYYGKSTLDGLNSIQRDPSLAPTEGASRPAPVPTAEGNSEAPVNIVLMGRLSRYFDIPVEKWQQAIRECVPEIFIDLNLKAFALGRGEN